jgi:hypothetical protein
VETKLEINKRITPQDDQDEKTTKTLVERNLQPPPEHKQTAAVIEQKRAKKSRWPRWRRKKSRFPTRTETEREKEEESMATLIEQAVWDTSNNSAKGNPHGKLKFMPRSTTALDASRVLSDEVSVHSPLTGQKHGQKFRLRPRRGRGKWAAWAGFGGGSGRDFCSCINITDDVAAAEEGRV